MPFKNWKMVLQLEAPLTYTYSASWSWKDLINRFTLLEENE